MINTIALKIVAELETLGLFKKVERTIDRTILQTPPSAAVLLAYDKEKENKPQSRELGWDIMIMVSALSADRAARFTDDLLDTVRNRFVNWRPFTTGGVLPAKAPMIRLEGIHGTLQVYSLRLTMEVLPHIIDKEEA